MLKASILSALPTAAILLSATAFADSSSLTEQVNALWQAKDYQAAQQLLAGKVDRKTKDAELLALLGQTEALLDNKEEAEGLLEKALKYNAEHADYQHWYATVSCNLASSASMFSAMGYAKRCRQAYEKALDLAPQNPRSYIALGSFYAQAPGIAGGDKAKALDLASRLSTLDALQGAILQLKATDVSDEATFNALLANSDILSKRPESYFQRGMTLAREEKYDQAIVLLQQALQQPAADDDAMATLTESRYQLARCAVLGKTAVAEGIAAMQLYLQDNPASDRLDWAQLRLAQLYVLSDQTDKANAITQPLLASTDDDKLKAELKKLL